MSTTPDSKKFRKFEGIVTSDKMQKTIVVRVDRLKMHSKYKKYYRISKKFKVHDEKNEAKVGDKVAFVEVRPLSRDKRWNLVKVL